MNFKSVLTNKKVLGIGAVVLLLTVGGISWALLKEPAYYAEPAFGAQVTESVSTGCIRQRDAIRSEELLYLANDRKAGLQVIRDNFDSGMCYAIGEGKKVYIEAKAHHPNKLLDKAMHGLICARKEGEPNCIWLGAWTLFPSINPNFVRMILGLAD